MARVVNYEQKIEGLKAKIEKKTEELKNLKADLAKYEDAKTKTNFKVLNEYLAAKGIAPDEAMGKLKELYGD